MKHSLFIAFTLLAFISSFGQSYKKPPKINSRTKEQDKFLEKQWWLGFKGGLNLTQATPEKRYAVFSPTNYDPGLNDKVYQNFDKTGSQATIEATFYYKGFSFSFQPTYRHVRFAYANSFEWHNPENANENLTLDYQQEQKIDYADLPILVKYEVTKTRLRPYVQLGAFYSLLINATKSVKITGTDHASGGTNPITNDPVIIGARDLFHNNYWGLVGGIGVNYNLGNIRLVLDASYRMGMSNITNTKNRFGNDRLSGIGDAQDDMKLNNIVVSAGALFPMRFLSNSFKTLDR